jgi:hypothetical protein
MSAAKLDMAEGSVTLYLLAAQLDGMEDLRTATMNRFSQATRSTEDADGEVRGLGLDPESPEVKAVKIAADNLATLEHQVVLELQRAMRRHPLGAWQKQALGVGEKQLARLLASIGDPFWNSLHERPRTVSELWAYCGLHTIEGGGARRARGQQANWSTDAKTRAYLIAASCIKKADSPYRAVYDERRAVTAERVHVRPCAQCNGAGTSSELIESPWRAGHQHADALRVASKRVLRDLWRAARDWHAENTQ